MDQFYSSNRLPWAAIQEIQAVCAPMPSGHGLSHLKDAEDISAPGSGMPKEMCRAEKAGADPCSARETGHSSSFKSNYWLMKNATGPKPATSGTPSFNLLALRANTSITSRAGNPTPNKMIMKMSQIVLRFALSLFLTGLVALTLQGHSCNNPPQLGNGEAELGETGDVTFPGIAQYPTRLTIDGEVIDPAYCAQANVSAPSPINDYTVIDPATLQLTAEVATGKSPSGIAITRDGKLILTADRDSNQVSIIDAATLQVTAAVPVGDRPFGITVDAAGTRAYTANVRSDDVSVVDIPSARTIATYKVGRRPYAVALASGKAFVTDQYAGTVTVVDLSSGKTIKSIPVGEHPEGIEADASGRHLYVACWMENTLERIDSTTLKVTGKVEVGDGPRAFGAFLDAAGQDAARASPKDAH